MTSEQAQHVQGIENLVKLLNEAISKGQEIGVKTEMTVDGGRFGNAKNVLYTTYSFRTEAVAIAKPFDE